MNKEDKVHTAIMLTLTTIFILLIGVLIGKFICDEVQIIKLVLGTVWAILFIPIIYIAIISFIINAVINEKRRRNE